jgi:hypothetical protein
MTHKLPRPGTRRRALFDVLLKNAMEAKYTTWSEAKNAYDNHPPAYPVRGHSRYIPGKGVMSDPRNYSGMEVSRMLKKFTRKISRGVYRLNDEFLTPHLPQITAFDSKGNTIKPGDKIEANPGGAALTFGKIYTVTHITKNVRDDARYNFVHVEGDRPGSAGHFGTRFIKVTNPCSEVKVDLYTKEELAEFRRRQQAWHLSERVDYQSVCKTCGNTYAEHNGEVCQDKDGNYPIAPPARYWSGELRYICKCGATRLDSLGHVHTQFGGYTHSHLKCTEPVANPFNDTIQAAPVIPGKLPITRPSLELLKELDKMVDNAADAVTNLESAPIADLISHIDEVYEMLTSIRKEIRSHIGEE